MLAIALAIAAAALSPLRLSAQSAAASPSAPVASAAPPTAPPPSGQIFPLSQVHRGLTATAWTVFSGTQPEPMEVEILGVLRGARGPGQDMILAQLHGAKADYTGVVEGMSGSPVYIGNKLLGSISYRIGQFSKDAIAGITPIEQMLEIRDLPIDTPAQSASLGSGPIAGSIPTAASNSTTASASPGDNISFSQADFQAIETPLVMGGFRPEAIQLWQQRMAGTSLQSVAAGGMGSSSDADTTPSEAARATLVPGSAISEQLVRGDVEIAATCTITYIDPKQLLACGHPVLQSGPISAPMTTAEVLATLASPLNAFKIINTGATVGAFTEDRESGIRGLLGAQARMIPMHVTIDGPGGNRKVNVEILDLPALTAQAVLVVLYNSLLQANGNTADTSYHVTGTIDLANYPPSPLDLWVSAGDQMPSSMAAALLTGERFSRLYGNQARQGTVRAVNLHVEAIPKRIQVDLVSARVISSNIVHAGDNIVVEATLRGYQQPDRNVRIPIQLPARLPAGGLRVLISDGGTLDRTLDQPKGSTRTPDIQTLLAQDRRHHPADRIYVSLLAPDTQAGVAGQTLTSLPLSMANALETVRVGQEINLNGESAELAADAPAGGVLTGFQIVSLFVQSGGGL